MSSAIRPALDTDLDALEAIENAADRRFLERFRPDDWLPAPGGRARAQQPGFLLVAVVDEVPVGFAHVVELGGGLHLEQLSVHPSQGRRGHGAALVRAVLAEAARRGVHAVTLRTYADVPWNAPFYARLGFVETEPGTDALRGLAEVEALLGIDRYGRRVQMTAPTTCRVADDMPPASSRS